MAGKKSDRSAQTIYYGGTILTMDEAVPKAEAMLVEGERIQAVGALAELESRLQPGVERVDLGGYTLLPGFNDNHIHVNGLGDNFSLPNLMGLDKAGIIEALKVRYADSGSSDWVVGNNWDYPTCPDPHKRDLDEVFPDRPVLLFQFSGHAAWCNSAGLKKLGVDRDTKDWPSGGVLKDETGEPTGVLREPQGLRKLKKYWILKLWNKKVINSSFRAAMVKLREAGITSVQDNTWFPPSLTVLQRLKKSGELTCRVSAWVIGEYPPIAFLMNIRRYDDLWIRKGPMKYFLDGAFSSHSAWMTEDYADDPGNSGKGREADLTAKKIERYVRKGRQIASHAIGDRATKEYCDAVERLAERYPGVRDLRIRIEHGQLIRDEDIPRIRDLGMYVCAQPSALIDPEKDERLLGHKRANKAYAYRSLLDAGVHLSFGSDYPGENSYEPLRGIQNAVDRKSDERIGVDEALKCYTIESARAEGTERIKGSISAGKLADFVILERNPLEVPSSEIAAIRVIRTIVGGAMVFERVSSDVEEIKGSV